VQGNVREWVSDFYTSDYYSVSPAVDPPGPQLNVQGRGPQGGRGPRGRGGPVGPLPPVELPPGATPEQQIQALRQEVAQLRQELQQLRNEFEAGPLRGGPPRGGPNRGGPPQGPVTVGPDGQFIDPLDGLPTGLPVVRGGGWDQAASFQRVSARYSYYGPALRLSNIGFRLVREPLRNAR
jgi:hypothetical protein